MSDEQKQDEKQKNESVLQQGSEVKSETEELKKQIEELTGKWKRALADYDNLKKETAKEREGMGKFAMGMAAAAFLEVFENLKKAVRQDYTNGRLGRPTNDTNKQLENWKQGLGHILNQFADVLKQMGIEEIKTVGEKFDLKRHEAVGHEAVEGVEPDIVVKEVEGGYQMGGRVIKAAKVIVAK